MAKYATNASGAMLLINLIQVTEPISGSVVPLAMFIVCLIILPIEFPIVTKRNRMKKEKEVCRKRKADKVNHVYYILGTVQMHDVYIGYSPGHTGTHDWHWHMVGMGPNKYFPQNLSLFQLLAPVLR